MKFTLTLLISITCNLLYSQVFDPVKVQLSVKNVAHTEYLLSFELKIDTPFKVVSAYSPHNGDSLNFDINYDNLNYFKLVGGLQEFPVSKVETDSAFGSEVRFNRNKVVYSQRIQVLTKNLFLIKGEIQYFARTHEMATPPVYLHFVLNFDGKNLSTKIIEE